MEVIRCQENLGVQTPDLFPEASNKYYVSFYSNLLCESERSRSLAVDAMRTDQSKTVKEALTGRGTPGLRIRVGIFICCEIA